MVVKGTIAAVIMVASVFAFRQLQWSRGEEALVRSVCAGEIDAVAHFRVARELKQENDRGTSAIQTLQIRGEYERSSLAAHIPALRRMADAPGFVAHMKRLAVVAAQRCPEVFVEPIKAEKPLAYTVGMSPKPD